MKKTTATPPTLKNTYSSSPRIFEDIGKTLREHQARQISFDYDEQGRTSAITFVLELKGSLLRFRLPARLEKAESIFLKQKRAKSARFVSSLTETEREQSARTAWANIRDWLAAQMALVDLEMASVEEIFLPYMLEPSGQRTFFEVMRDQQFLLGAPGSVRIEEIE